MSDSPIPPSGDDEPEVVTGIHEMPKTIRTWAESQSRKVKKLEKHFEPRGVVYEMDRKLDRFFVKQETERSIFKSVPTWLAVLALVSSAVAWYVHAQLSQKVAEKPEPPSASEIAREVLKQQQEKPR